MGKLKKNDDTDDDNDDVNVSASVYVTLCLPQIGGDGDDCDDDGGFSGVDWKADVHQVLERTKRTKCTKHQAPQVEVHWSGMIKFKCLMPLADYKRWEHSRNYWKGKFFNSEQCSQQYHNDGGFFLQLV